LRTLRQIPGNFDRASSIRRLSTFVPRPMERNSGATPIASSGTRSPTKHVPACSFEKRRTHAQAIAIPVDESSATTPRSPVVPQSIQYFRKNGSERAFCIGSFPSGIRAAKTRKLKTSVSSFGCTLRRTNSIQCSIAVRPCSRISPTTLASLPREPRSSGATADRCFQVFSILNVTICPHRIP
jgi:hypothetical protein